MRGTWQTTDHGPGGGLVLLVIGALLLLGSGAAAAIATAVIVALLTAAAVVVLAVAGLAGYLVYRARRPIPGGHGLLPAVTHHQLPAPERPALEPPAARELHQHWHLHIAPGTDPEKVAEILRRHERPE